MSAKLRSATARPYHQNGSAGFLAEPLPTPGGGGGGGGGGVSCFSTGLVSCFLTVAGGCGRVRFGSGRVGGGIALSGCTGATGGGGGGGGAGGGSTGFGGSIRPMGVPSQARRERRFHSGRRIVVPSASSQTAR